MAIFYGAQGNNFLFMNENKFLASWWPQSMKKVLLLPEFIKSNLKEMTALRTQLPRDILKPEALKQYRPVMDALALEHLAKEYAKLEVLVFLHNVVRRFKLEKDIPNKKIVYYASPMPVYGLLVRLQPHQES